MGEKRFVGICMERFLRCIAKKKKKACDGMKTNMQSQIPQAWKNMGKSLMVFDGSTAHPWKGVEWEVARVPVAFNYVHFCII